MAPRVGFGARARHHVTAGRVLLDASRTGPGTVAVVRAVEQGGPAAAAGCVDPVPTGAVRGRHGTDPALDAAVVRDTTVRPVSDSSRLTRALPRAVAPLPRGTVAQS